MSLTRRFGLLFAAVGLLAAVGAVDDEGRTPEITRSGGVGVVR